jgi:hypothetical protein
MASFLTWIRSLGATGATANARVAYEEQVWAGAVLEVQLRRLSPLQSRSRAAA